MRRFLGFVSRLSDLLEDIGGVVLVLMVLLTVADVILRYLGRPILGTYEMVSLAGALVTGFAIPQASLKKVHVTADLLIEKLPQGKRDVTQVTTRLMGIALFVLLSWNLIDMGASMYKTGEGTLTLCLPLYPIAYILGICCFVESLVLLCDIVKIVYGRGQNE